ncbi:MAG: ribose-phosphate pyrophosphokinase [Kofleriaceae bacterium]
MIVIAAPGFDEVARPLASALGATVGGCLVRHFPDGECYVRLDVDVAGADVVLVGGLDRPDARLLPTLFLAATAKDLGARRVGLVAPYLSFMRQDSRFHPGEGLTSIYFARLLATSLDWLCTVDPHLHRWASLEQVYPIPTRVVHAAPAIAAWLRAHVERPVLIGPDAESEQWVGAVAALLDAPFLVLEKTRKGDRDVIVTAPNLGGHRDRTPVVIDDIISTGRTMVETLLHLRSLGTREPVCVGIHAVMADGALEDLVAAGAARVVTCDTIAHPTNRIAVGALLTDAVAALAAG